MPTLPTLLDTKQAARILGIKERTLANARCAGSLSLPYVRIGGRVMYREDDLLAFIERGTVRPGEAE